MANETMLDGERAERYAALRKVEAGTAHVKFYHAVNRETLRPLCGIPPAHGWHPVEARHVTCARCIVVLNKAREKRSPTQRSWDRMKQRCNDPKRTEYPDYGGRGIRVCERWNNSFDAFLADMGERPAGKTLDRYPDPDGNYEPGNCRWATALEQRHNRSDAAPRVRLTKAGTR